MLSYSKLNYTWHHDDDMVISFSHHLSLSPLRGSFKCLALPTTADALYNLVAASDLFFILVFCYVVLPH